MVANPVGTRNADLAEMLNHFSERGILSADTFSVDSTYLRKPTEQIQRHSCLSLRLWLVRTLRSYGLSMRQLTDRQALVIEPFSTARTSRNVYDWPELIFRTCPR